MSFLRRWFVPALDYEIACIAGKKHKEHLAGAIKDYIDLLQRSQDDRMWRIEVTRKIKAACLKRCGSRDFDERCEDCAMDLIAGLEVQP